MVEGEADVEELGTDLKGEGTVGPANDARVGLLDLGGR